MPVQGLSNGSQPVTSYNYGAGQYSRGCASIRFTMGVAVACTAVFWAAAMLFPGPLIQIFSREPDVVAAGIPTLMQAQEGADLVVTPRALDSVIAHGAALLAGSVNRALQPRLTVQQLCWLTG